MGEFSNYPDALDTSNEIPKITDNVTPIRAEVINRLRDAILLIESELGVQPSSTYSSVRARLDALETGAGGGGSFFQETISIESDAQSSFTLALIPTASNTVQMFVNGLKQQYGVDYTVSGSNVSYSALSLLTTDTLEFSYLF